MTGKLEKSWKNKMLSAIGAAGLAMPSSNLETQDKTPEQAEKPAVTVKDYSQPWGENPSDKFLSAISFLESSGGKNLKHRLMETGLHAGSSALGQFAIMPNTIRDIHGLMQQKGSPLQGALGDKYKDEEFSQLATLPQLDMARQLKKRPELGLRAARYLATHLHHLHGGDPERMGFSWRFGHNRPTEHITPKMLEHSGYVKKFNQIYNTIKPNLPAAPASVQNDPEVKPH